MKTDCEPIGGTDCLLRDNTEEVTQGGTVILTGVECQKLRSRKGS